MKDSATKNILVQQKKKLVEFAREACKEKLFLSTSGNISLRIPGEKYLISGSGKELGKLKVTDVSLLGLADNKILNGPKPSSELNLHKMIYDKRKEAAAILHFQAKCATAIACMKNPPANLDFIPEIPAYVKSFAYVPYEFPGTVEFAESVARAFGNPKINLVQLQNHGQVVIGETPEIALRRAIFFELACCIFLRSPEPVLIPPAEAERLRKAYSV